MGHSPWGENAWGFATTALGGGFPASLAASRPTFCDSPLPPRPLTPPFYPLKRTRLPPLKASSTQSSKEISVVP